MTMLPSFGEVSKLLSYEPETGVLVRKWVDDSERGKWTSRITVDGRSVHLGRHSTADEARAAYLQAKRKFHQFQPVPRDVAA